MGHSKKKVKYFFIFVFPALLFYAVFMLIPSLGTIVYSFTDWNGLMKNINFIGIKNYLEIYQDKTFLDSIIFTTKFVVVSLILQNVLALCLALIIDSMGKSRGLYRTVFFMPNMFSLVITSLMWVFIFTGILPEFAAKTNLLFFDRSWLGDPNVSFWSIVLVTCWTGTGYLMVIYMAALQGVPQDIKDASVVDGATGFKKLIYIKLPLIMHAITICIFLSLVGSYKIFDQIYVLTGGGPANSTVTIAFNIFDEAFKNMRYGYGSAKCLVLFIMLLVISFAQVSVMKKREVAA